MPTKASTLLTAFAICAVLSVACASPPTPAPGETLPTDTPAPVSTAASEPTSTPVPTDTPTPVPTPTFEPRSRQEVFVDCRQDEQAEEFLIEIAEETTVGDLAADPAIADCYGDTIHEKAVNVATALDAQQELAQDADGDTADRVVRTGTYRLFLSKEGRSHGEANTYLSIVTPTPMPITVSPELRIQLVNEFGDINWAVYLAATPASILEENSINITINGQHFDATADQISEMVSLYDGVVADYDESAPLFQTPAFSIAVQVTDPRRRVLHSDVLTLTNWHHSGLLHLPVDPSSFGPGFWTLGSADKDLSDAVARDFFGNTFRRRFEFVGGRLYQFPGVGPNHAGAVDLGFIDGNPTETRDIYSFCEDCRLHKVAYGDKSEDGQTWTEHNIIFVLPVAILDRSPTLNGDRIAAYVGHITELDPAFTENYAPGDLVPVGTRLGRIADRPGENRDAHVHFGVYDLDQPGDPAWPADPNFVNIDIVYLIRPDHRPLLDPQGFYDQESAP